MKTKLSKCFFIVFFLLLGVSNQSIAITVDTIKKNRKWDVGLDFFSPVQFPFLSIDYRFSQRFAIGLELRPNFIANKSEHIEYRQKSPFFRRLAENSFLKSYRSKLVLYLLNRRPNKMHFFPALEFSYSYHFGKDYSFVESKGESTYDYGGISKKEEYFAVFNRKTRSISLLLNYGKKEFNIYLGIGLAYDTDYGRGYKYSRTSHILHSSESLYPFVKTESYYSPVYRLGIRIGLLSLFCNKKSKE